MNEKIKELAEKSGYYLYDLTATHGTKTVETDSTDEWITLERFAELVRQDEREACAKAMQPMLRDMISRSQAAEIIRGRTE